MADRPNRPGFETLAIHAGAAPDPTTGARITPIYQTTAYVFDDVDHAASLFNLQTYGYLYSRLTNPTVSVLEERVASLEGGRGAIACASGMIAIHTALMAALTDRPKRVVAASAICRGAGMDAGMDRVCSNGSASSSPAKASG